MATTAVAGRTVVSELRSSPPLTLRQTGPHTVHLVATAAGPLGGDTLTLDIDVAPGTSLDVRSAAATLVLPGQGASRMLITASAGPGATLRYAPEPTIVTCGAVHHQVVRLSLGAGSRLTWREELILGRHGEPGGRCRARLDAVYAGVPLLRQSLDTGFPASPAVYGTARCLGTTLLAGRTGEGAVADGVAVLPLAGPGLLVSALADDAIDLRRRLTWGESRIS
ncbi:urease accessory protein UreD [Nonomuraea typhae]|uniref:urease accessory protein UreD n=1 Tax=Nonomuraea typhae TaxID=2603600 RepID=UPI001FE776D7|nr:urease accessory protein UreD [Nonomuraea typhae]